MRAVCALLFYRLLAWLVQPLVLFKLCWRARKEPEYGLRMAARFGYYGKPSEVDLAGKGKWIWVHAVSLGETRAAALFIDALREERPDMRLLLTHSTATGWQAGRTLVRQGDTQTWLPWDSVGAVRRFFAYYQPSQGLIMETEAWPELLGCAARLGTPLSLVNARMSERSYLGFARLPSLFSPTYAALTWVGAQSELDAQRLRLLGASRVDVVGNVKMDVSPDAEQIAAGKTDKKPLARPILLLASSRDGEEAMLLDVLDSMPLLEVEILLVPRHPQRFDAVAALASARGWLVRRRTQNKEEWLRVSEAHTNLTKRTVWLGDSMGEMAYYYALSDAVLMGGSFAPYGGQNFMEALACGCAVWLGPHTYNFAYAVEQALHDQAVTQTSDMESAVLAALRTLEDTNELKACTQRGADFLARHRGASQRYAKHVLTFSSGPPSNV